MSDDEGKVSKFKVLSFPKKVEESEKTPPENEPVKEVVEILEEWLGMAKAGDIRSIAVVGVDRHQDINTESFHLEGDFFALSHGTRILDQRVTYDFEIIDES